MFLADRREQIKYSSFFIAKTPYSPSGRRKTLVYPAMVSGLRVAATRNTFLSENFSTILEGTSRHLILIRVYF
jgi:hypothetical protein